MAVQKGVEVMKKKTVGILMLSVVFLSIVGVSVFAVGWVFALIFWGTALTVLGLIVFGIKFLCEG